VALPETMLGELTGSSRAPAGLRGPASKGKEKGREWGRRRERAGTGRKGEGRRRGKGMGTEGKERKGKGKEGGQGRQGTPHVFTWIDACALRVIYTCKADVVFDFSCKNWKNA